MGHTCFIILPISTPTGGTHSYRKNHFAKVLKQIYVPAVRKIRFKPIEPLRRGTYAIEQKILARLRDSDLVLCDISSVNPNVLFELGIRRALNKPFAIVTDSLTTVPYDLKNFNYYQYDPADVHKSKQSRETLIKEVSTHLRETIEEQGPMPAEPLIGATACGITRVYPQREAALNDILASMEKASRRLWIMGVGLSESFKLRDRLDAIEKEIKTAAAEGKKFDARVLILDALTSTGVFRSLLETKVERSAKIVNAKREAGDERPGDPYFNQRHYHDFLSTWQRFKDTDELEDLVRFYGHAPAGWLLIADNTAYFEPYTFGYDPESKRSTGEPIGPLMPVFRFEPAGYARPFKILENHFNRLWLTTDTDLFHVEARHAEARDTLSKIFHNRGYWLKQVHHILHNPGSDRRRYPRKVCKSNLENFVSRRRSSQHHERVEEVLNFSRQGLAFKLKSNLRLGERIKITSRVPRRPKVFRGKEEAGTFVKKTLVDPYDGWFRVIHKREEGKFFIVGLQPIKKKPK